MVVLRPASAASLNSVNQQQHTSYASVVHGNNIGSGVLVEGGILQRDGGGSAIDGEDESNNDGYQETRLDVPSSWMH